MANVYTDTRTKAKAVFLSDRTYNLQVGLGILAGILVTAFSTVVFKDTLGLVYYVHPVIFSIAYIVIGLIAQTVVKRSDSTAVSFAFYMLMAVATGALLSACIPYVGSTVLFHAAMSTITLTLLMIAVSTAFPSVFQKMGKGLCVTLLIAVVVELAASFIFAADLAFMDWIFVMVFALLIGYDWVTGSDYPQSTKYAIITALYLYLNVINIFIRLISIFSRNSRR